MNLIICGEMVGCALAQAMAFPYTDYMDDRIDQGNTKNKKRNEPNLRKKLIPEKKKRKSVWVPCWDNIGGFLHPKDVSTRKDLLISVSRKRINPITQRLFFFGSLRLSNLVPLNLVSILCHPLIELSRGP